jgi:APA family basic amino acid/polyamine antiporter
MSSTDPADAERPAAPHAHLGLPSGIGLVIANMIGVGIMTSDAIMVRPPTEFGAGPGLPPTAIFLVWIIQGALAICGALSYAALAQVVPRSGGEYRYLSDLIHPILGYVAGWTSLLIGFSAPVAANAIAAGGFLGTIVPGIDPLLVGAGIIVLITLLQALDLQTGKWSQDLLVALKVLLVVGFIGLGVVAGENRWPTWNVEAAAQPITMGLLTTPLFFAAYAYSGWNAAIYCAQEFRHPRRDVASSMVIGTLVVMVLYLAVTWVFVANLDARDMAGWKENEVTAAHLIAAKLVGPMTARVVSVGVIIVLVSAVSAMTMLGPRVYATMAHDGFLPRAFAARVDRPPVWSVLLQGAIALLLLYTNKFDVLMNNVGAILTLMAALTVTAVFRARWRRDAEVRPGTVPLVAAAIYLGASIWLFWYAFKLGRAAGSWILAVCAAATIAYGATKLVRKDRRP